MSHLRRLKRNLTRLSVKRQTEAIKGMKVTSQETRRLIGSRNMPKKRIKEIIHKLTK